MSVKCLRLSAIFLTALILPPSARAHNLLVKYHLLPGARVQIESYFDTGDAPLRATVKIHRVDNTVLSEGKLDRSGLYTFGVTEAEDLLVEVKDRTGHRAETRISAKELKQSIASDALALLTPHVTPLIPLTVLAARSAIGQPDEDAPNRPGDRGHGPPWDKLLLGIGILLGLGALALVIQKVRAHR
jgi:hypothetical protein